jgi:hypothetical protein
MLTVPNAPQQRQLDRPAAGRRPGGQPALSTELDLGTDWSVTVAETNAHAVGAPNDYLIHAEFPSTSACGFVPKTSSSVRTPSSRPRRRG